MPTDTTVLPPGTEICLVDAPFNLVHGAALDSCRIAYELSGPARAPVVAVLGGISAHRHPFVTDANPEPGWWQGFGGPDAAIDSRAFRVLAFDYLGGCGDSTGPGTLRDHPAIAPADQARLLAILLDRLGIESLHAAVGCSYGGMVAMEFAARFPRRVQRLIAIAAAHEAHPMATAWRALQRRLLRIGAEHDCVAEALGLARALALTTYRSAREFAQRFGREPSWRGGRACFPVETYLEARGERFAADFDAAAYHCLSESIDLHGVLPEAIRVETTVITFDSDQLVPPEQGQELARRIAAPTRHITLPSLYGHDAFLKERELLGQLLRTALNEEPQ